MTILIQDISSKRTLRRLMRIKRASINAERRTQAQLQAFSCLAEICKKFQYVLSYSCFGDEFSTQLVNQFLAERGSLVLPRVENDELGLYQVENYKKDLQLSSWGILEPNPVRCKKIDRDEIALMIIPGYAFDKHHHRLGYGKGFYDRLLQGLPNHIHTVGLGFQEQFQEDLLPVSSHDIPLKQILLF